MYRFNVYPPRSGRVTRRMLDEFSMLRGLAVNIVGYSCVITGLTNKRFIAKGRAEFALPYATHARRFQRGAQLTGLRIRRVRAP
jgi:hypothetical protein